MWETDRLRDAVADLDQRYLAALSSSDRALWQDYHAFADALGTHDVGAITAVLAPGGTYHDYRPMSFGVLDWPALLATYPPLFDEVPDVWMVWNEVHAIQPGIGYVRVEIRGQRAGGELVVPMRVVAEHDDAGLITRLNVFALEDRAAADARFAELSASARRRTPIEECYAETWVHARAGDWDAYRRLLNPDVTFEDRRAIVGGPIRVGADAMIEVMRAVIEAEVTDRQVSLIASRGERLALVHALYAVGDAEVEFLQVAELDDEQRFVHLVSLEVDRRDEAFAELDARSGDDPRSRTLEALHDALDAHDVGALAAVVSEDVVCSEHPLTDRRPLVGSEYLDACATRFTAEPDARWAITAVHAISDRAIFFSHERSGTPRLGVAVVEDGRVADLHTYPPEQRADAEARFAELSVAGARLENLASRAVRAGNDVGLAGNEDAVVAGVHPDVVLVDRRPLLGGFTAEGPEAYGQFVSSVFRMGVTSVAIRTIARRGDHLALVHVVHAGSTASLETLQVVQLDEEGRHILRHELFDTSQIDEAIAELDARFLATVGVAERAWRAFWSVGQAGMARDPAALARLLSPGFEMVDHRTAGYGRIGAADYLATFRAAWEAAEDIRWTTTRDLGSAPGGLWAEVEMSGTRDGGRFVISYQVVIEVDDAGLRRGDIFDLEDDTSATARWAELLSEG
jgi:hypothetical protein